MADLNQLYDALELIKQDKKSVKLFFYFLNKDNGQMQSGFFSINEGSTCTISYLNKPNDIALKEIPQLTFTKVTSLPAALVDQSTAPFGICAIDEILNRLNPENFVKAKPEPVPDLKSEPDSDQGLPGETSTPAAVNQPYVFYSHITLQHDATQLLETLYGTSAIKKVEEIAHTSSPHQHPIDFLDKCKQHASMMLGPKKADEIFQPIYDKVAHGHSHH